jgi:phage-related minor tail protein
MADRIKGITIELDGDTTKLSNALKGVNKEIRDTQSNLKDVNKLLKMDPGNADLLAQKQKYLTDAIDATKKKLAEEKEALAQLKAGPQTEETKKQQEALTREIEETKQSLEGLEDEYYAGPVENTFNETLDPLDQMTVVMNNLKDLGAEIVDAAAPMITEAMTQIKDVVTALKDAWDGLSPGMEEAVVKAALIAAAVGPVVVGVGKVVTAVGSVTCVVGKMVGFLSGTVIPAIGAVSVPILPIIGIIAAVIAAVVAVIEIVKHWGEISEWFGGVWETVCSGV